MTSERRWKRPVTLTSFPSLFVSLRVSSPPPSRLSPSVSDSLCSSSPTAEPVGGDQRETETGGDRKARVHGKQRTTEVTRSRKDTSYGGCPCHYRLPYHSLPPSVPRLVCSSLRSLRLRLGSSGGNGMSVGEEPARLLPVTSSVT